MKLISKIKSMGIRLALLKLTGFEGEYTCGFRERTQQELYRAQESGGKKEFNLLPYSKEYWYADPLIYTYRKQTAIFMEAYDKKSDLGRIAYATVGDGKWTQPQVIIKEDFHMSFPTLFEYQNELYMLPETSRAKSMTLYRCISFPDQWEKLGSFLPGKELVDSVVVAEEDNLVLFLASQCDPKNDLRSKFYSFWLSIIDGKLQVTENKEFNQNQNYTFESRNAGPLIQRDRDTKLLPIQTSTAAVYGYSVKYMPLRKNSLQMGECLREITPKDISTGLSNVIGIHTYSLTEELEIIDLQYMKFHADKWIKRVINKLKR